MHKDFCAVKREEGRVSRERQNLYLTEFLPEKIIKMFVAISF